MRITSALVAVLLATALCAPGTAKAQTQIDIGPRLGFDLGDLEDLFIGADGRFTTSLPVVIEATFDYYFTDGNINFWSLGGNALYEFDISNPSIAPYAGAGLSISRISIDADLGFLGRFDASSTHAGLNLIGGATFTAGNLRPFAQAQITIGDVDLFTIGGGLLFTVSGG